MTIVPFPTPKTKMESDADREIELIGRFGEAFYGCSIQNIFTALTVLLSSIVDEISEDETKREVLITIILDILRTKTRQSIH